MRVVLNDTAHASKLATLKCVTPLIMQLVLGTTGTAVRIAQSKAELEATTDGGFSFDDDNGILSVLWKGDLWAICVTGDVILKYQTME